MASSSVSQESIDIEDYETYARRSRIRTMRGRVTAGHNKTEYHESMESGDHIDPQEDDNVDLDANGVAGEHGESPTRLGGRLKDKRVIRPTHLHKGKAVKDKRKLREKRRSTGVVHMPHPSTESTGDSLDEEDTRKNTQYNEFIDADNPQTPEEERKAFAARSVRNKSPSDLEADLEDNQDYDSTVSQSETNLTTIGQSSTQTTPTHQQAPPIVAAAAPPPPPPQKPHPQIPHNIPNSTSSSPHKHPVFAARLSGVSGGHIQPHSKVQSVPDKPPATHSKPNVPVLAKEKSVAAAVRPVAERAPVKAQASSAPVTIRPSQNTPARWKDSPVHVGGDIESRRRHKVHWQTSEGSTSPSNNSNSNTAGSVEELDLCTRLRELEQVLARERQEKSNEKEERQKLQELLYEREKTIEHLQREISLLHQDLENLDIDNVNLRQENRSIMRAISHNSRHSSRPTHI